jgi:hypothetical protein
MIAYNTTGNTPNYSMLFQTGYINSPFFLEKSYSWNPVVGTWYHWAFVRNSNSLL